MRASDVREAPPINGTVEDATWQRLVALTPALPPSPASVDAGAGTLNVSCHVSVVTMDGREALALNAFRYERIPMACTILSVDSFEFSIAHLTSLYVCVWPYALCAIAGLWLLHGGWRVHTRIAELWRIEPVHARRGVEVALDRDEPL